MTLIAYTKSIEMIQLIKPVIDAIKKHDKSLADQIKRCSSSVVLNIAEGSVSQGGNQKSRYYNAFGSTKETRAAIKIALVWQYIDYKSYNKLENILDKISALLYGLTK